MSNETQENVVSRQKNHAARQLTYRMIFTVASQEISIRFNHQL